MGIEVKPQLNGIKQATNHSVHNTKKEHNKTTNETIAADNSSVKISFKVALESLDDMTPVDTDKVNKLKQQIAEGSYQVNSQQLAKNILRFEADLR